jgi:glycine/D-amino acid oxidase-like deaminating enzyme
MGKKKVAIIGAGCFGSTIATDLAKQGFSVSIFEKNSILGGSTYGSIRRVHSGPHYPRHLPTALQSRLGYDSFLKRFSDAIFSNFPNYYAIAKDLSRTSSEDFVSFLELAQVPNQRLDVR